MARNDRIMAADKIYREVTPPKWAWISKALIGSGTSSGIPDRHRAFDLADSTDPKWNAAFDRVMAATGRGSIIGMCGARGPGKTQLAVEAVKAVAMFGGYASYDRLADFYMQIKSTYRRESEKSEVDIIDEWRRPKVLVLDECHERAATPWENTMLNHLVDCRYGDMTDTIMIANVKASEFRQLIGPSISSRMQESGGVIECDWQSFRTAKQGG